MNKDNVQKMVGMALFAAIVVVLQIVGTYIRIGTFSISLVLIPIVVGAAIFDIWGGAFLGAVFGAVVIFWDCMQFGNPFWAADPLLTAGVCLAKGILAGVAAALIYKAISRKNKYVAAYAAAIVCPIVNTGIFSASIILLFKDVLTELAGGTNVLYFAFIGMTGINFIIELAVNIILAPVIVSVIKMVRSARR